MSYPSNSDGVAQDQLKAFVERIERLEEEQHAINSDKSEVYKEAKGVGFDVKVLRRIIADRRQDANARAEFEAIYDLYMSALNGVVRAHVEIIEEIPPAHVAAAADAQPVSQAEELQSGSSAPIPENVISDGARVAADGPDDARASIPQPSGQQPPTAGDNARKLRPYCLKTDDLSKCAGQGRKGFLAVRGNQQQHRTSDRRAGAALVGGCDRSSSAVAYDARQSRPLSRTGFHGSPNLQLDRGFGSGHSLQVGWCFNSARDFLEFHALTRAGIEPVHAVALIDFQQHTDGQVSDAAEHIERPSQVHVAMSNHDREGFGRVPNSKANLPNSRGELPNVA